MDNERLKQGGGGDYDEPLARIRDIRSSERIFFVSPGARRDPQGISVGLADGAQPLAALPVLPPVILVVGLPAARPPVLPTARRHQIIVDSDPFVLRTLYLFPGRRV
jgi:hypothetical protein